MQLLSRATSSPTSLGSRFSGCDWFGRRLPKRYWLTYPSMALAHSAAHAPLNPVDTNPPCHSKLQSSADRWPASLRRMCSIASDMQ